MNACEGAAIGQLRGMGFMHKIGAHTAPTASLMVQVVQPDGDCQGFSRRDRWLFGARRVGWVENRISYNMAAVGGYHCLAAGFTTKGGERGRHFECENGEETWSAFVNEPE